MSTNRENTPRRKEVLADQRQIKLRAQRDKEEQQEKITQGGQPRRDGVTIGRRGQHHPRQQTAQLLAQAEDVANGGEGGGHGDGEGDQELRRSGQQGGQRRRGDADEQHYRDHHREACAQHHQDILHGCAVLPAFAQRAQRNHRKDNHNVLYDKQAKSDTAMEGVDFAFVAERFDDNDRG